MERYPLEAVMTLRKNELAEARERLCAANEVLDTALRVKEEAEAALERQRARLRAFRLSQATETHGRPVAELLRAQSYGARCKLESSRQQEHCKKQNTAHHKAFRRWEAARDQLAHARAALRALEKHQAHWLAEQDAQQAQREEAEQDGLNASRHARE